MLFQPGHGIGAGGGDGAAVLPDLLYSPAHQLSRHALAPETGIHKGVVDGRHVVPGRKGDLCDHIPCLIPGIDPSFFILIIHGLASSYLQSVFPP